MFERVVSSILTRLLGEYVEGSTFSTESVKLGIWRGYVVLEDMHIKKSLLDTLELPLALQHGIIGRLEIHIPWKTLAKDSVVINIDRVFLIAEPKFEWDADAIRRRERAIKRAKLTTAELFRSSLLDGATSGAANTDGQSKGRWGAGLQKWVTDRLITRIVDSLQIHVQEVHVRYEDHLSRPGVPFYLGVTVESLHIESTDEGWQAQPGPLQGPISSEIRGENRDAGDVGSRTATQTARSADEEAAGVSLTGRSALSQGGDGTAGGSRSDRLVKKELRVNQLAVYWNPAEDGNPCSMHLCDIPVEQAEVVISRLIAKRDQTGGLAAGAGSTLKDGKLRHRFVLEPVDIKGRLALSVNPMDRSQPRLQAEIDIGRISGRMEDFQLQTAMCLGASLVRYGEVGKYSKFRPTVLVMSDAAAWWRYAFAVVREELRANSCCVSRLPDIAERRKMRLEYMPLWQKAQGLMTTEYGFDGADAEMGDNDFEEGEPSRSSHSLDSSFAENLGVNENGPPSTERSSPTMAGMKISDAYASDPDVEALARPGGEDEGVQRATQPTRKMRRASAQDEAMATRARLEELEDELSVEDIIIFRAMAEREEMLRSGSGRKGHGNRWGIGGWVNWAMGTHGRAASANEEGDEVTEEKFRRLFTAINVDPSRAPPTQPEGDISGVDDRWGWSAVSVNLRAPEVAMALARSSDVGVTSFSELLSKKPEAKTFIDIHLREFCLCAELRGEDMDGVLASATLEDLGVYEVLFDDEEDDIRGWTPTRAPGTSYSLGDGAIVRSPIVTRRAISTWTGGGQERRKAGIDSMRLAEDEMGYTPVRPPLFEVHFEMNPRDPEYDAKIYLAIDQVEAELSPTAAWLDDVMKFAQAPQELENRPGLELAAANQLRQMRAQLEAKLEMVMSDRLRTYLDLNVKAPLLVIPVKVDLPVSPPPSSIRRRESGVRGSHKGQVIIGLEQAATDLAMEEKAASADLSPHPVDNVSSSGSDSFASLEGDGGIGIGIMQAEATSVVSSAAKKEFLIVDLGGVSLTTARLAHLHREDDDDCSGHADTTHAAIASDFRMNRIDSGDSVGEDEDGGGDSRGPRDGGNGRERTGASERSRATSDVESAPMGGAQGAREVWHANYYDVYNVEVCRAGVMLAKGRGGRDGDDGGREPAGGGGRFAGGEGIGDPRTWLINPFDIKVELHVSVIPSDPRVSQLKVYGDLPALRVRLSQGKLRRLAGMSIAMKSQLEASQATSTQDQVSSSVETDAVELSGGPLASGVEGETDGRPRSVGGMSSLSTFLDFQRSLSKRFDTFHEGRDSLPRSSAAVGSRDLRRLRLSDQSSNGGDAGAGASVRGDEEFASAWGGSSRGGSGSIYSADSVGYSTARSLSGESEFFDADEGDFSPLASGSASSPMAAALSERFQATVPDQESEDVGSGNGRWSRTASREETEEDGESEDGSLDFQDARDPLSEMDESLMAKEAEKADLLKHRQKLWEQLGRAGDAGAEVESIRLASERISIKLEACEDELKDLSTALEELTEMFDEAGKQTQLQLGRDGSGSLSPLTRQRSSESVGDGINEGTPTGGATYTPSSPFFPIPPSQRSSKSYSKSGRGGGPAQALSTGPNREIIMCGVTIPLIQVDLLQEKTVSTSRGNAYHSDFKYGASNDMDGIADGDGDEEEEVVSMRLVGLGMQLHSKSYSARLSFSMQDLDLEDRLNAAERRHSKTDGMLISSTAATVASSNVATGEEKMETGALSPSEERRVVELPLEALRTVEEDRAGDMVTARPRSFLWQRTRLSSRGGVTFRDDLADHEGRRPTSASAGRHTVHERAQNSAAVRRVSGERMAAEEGRPPGSVSRRDFIQLSYAMNKTPGRGEVVGGAARNGGLGYRAPPVQEKHRVKLLLGAVEVALEQRTILAVLRIASSVAASASPPPPSWPPSPPPASATADRAHLSDVPARSDLPRVESKSEREPTATQSEEGKAGGEGIMMPMMPEGMAATVTVDLAAISIALTEAGKGLVAVTLSAAHCKVNANSKQLKAVGSLGDFSILNLFQPPTCLPRAGASHGYVESPGVRTEDRFRPAPGRESEFTRSVDEGGQIVNRSVWVEPVVRRGEGASGPVFDVAVAVFALEDSTSPSGARRGRVKSGAGTDINRGGLEARAKFRLDKMRATFSIPFIDDMTRHVMSGPLVSHLLQGDRESPAAGVADPASPSPVDEPRTVDSPDVKEAADRASTSSGLAQHSAPPRNGPRDAPTQNDVEEEDTTKALVFIKVGLEISDCALELPLDYVGGGDNDRSSRATAEVGHLLVSTAWAPPIVDISGSGVERDGCRPERLGVLHSEALVSSAKVKMEPEGFELLQAVYARAIGEIPLAPGTGPTIYSEECHFNGSVTCDGEDDELARKLREISNVDSVVSRLPRRPPIRRKGVACSGIGGDRFAERAQVGVTVSPIRFSIAQSHALSIACFTVDASSRLANLSEFMARVSAANSPADETSDDAVAERVTGTDRAIDEAELLERPDSESLLPRVSRVSAQEPDGIALCHESCDNLELTMREDVDDSLLDNGSGAPTHNHDPAVAASDTEGEGPALPPFISTLIIEAVSVMLLKSTSDDLTCPPGATGLSVEEEKISRARDAGGAPAPIVRTHSTSSHEPEPYDRTASVMPPPVKLHAPLVFFEVRGIGVVADVPCRDAFDSSSPPGAPPTAEDCGDGSQHQAEVAIKSITLTDASESRKGSFTRILGGGGGLPPDEIEASGGSESRGSSDDDKRRILPAGWWHRSGSGDADGYGEQVLIRASLCPVSRTVSADASLASGHLMVLAAPVLDVMGLVADLEKDICQYASSEDRRQGACVVRGELGDGRRVSNGSDDECDLRTSPFMSSGDAYLVDPSLPHATSQHDLGSARPGGDGTRVYPELTAPPQVVHSRADVFEGGVGGAFSTQNRRSVSEPADLERLSWRQAVLALGGPALTEYLWIKRIEVSVSASDLQLWLPDMGNAHGPPEQALDDGPRRAGAIVASCERIFMAVSIAVSMLSGDVEVRAAEDLPASAARGAEEKDGRELDTVATESTVGNDGAYTDAGITESAEVAANVKTGEELCTIALGVHGVEVYTALASIAEFGVPIEPPLVPISVIPARNEVYVEGDNSIRPSPSTPEIGTLSRDDQKIAGRQRSFPEVERSSPRASSWRSGQLSDTRAPQPIILGGDGMRDDDVAGEAFGPSYGLGGGACADEGAAVVRGGGLDDDGGRAHELDSFRAATLKTGGIILPFNAELHHVLLARHAAAAAVGSPLMSDVDFSVTGIQVICLLDFPLAFNVMSNLLEPLMNGPPKRAERTQDDFAGDSRSRAATAGSATQEGRSEEGPSSQAGGTIPVDTSNVNSTGVAERGTLSSRGSSKRLSTERRNDTKDVALTEVTVSDLAAMWACYAEMKVEGLRITVVNNFYRQKRPSVNLNVQAITGELTASGAARTFQASIHLETRIDFYNAKLMAWEPLMELWSARMALEGSDSTPREESSEGVIAGSQVTALTASGGSVSWRRQAQGVTGRVLRQGQELVASLEGGHGRGRRERRHEGFSVSVRLISDETLNLNLTESLLENLAAISQAQQRKQGKLGGAWIVGASDEDSFSLNWLRNETGVPISCKAYSNVRSGGRDMAAPVEVSVGEEAPMPLLKASSPRRMGEVRTDGMSAAAAAAAAVPDQDVEGDGPGAAAALDDVVAGTERRESLPMRGRESLRRSIGATRSRDTSRSVPKAGNVRSATSRNEDLARARRPIRAVIIEFEDEHPRDNAAVQTRLSSPTSWRSLRPIDVDIIGQRVTTMVASSDMSSMPPTVEGARASSRLSGRGSWRPTSWTLAQVLESKSEGAKTIKLVTEVESHHGVKVLRVRSQIEVANGLGDLSMHVGLLGEASMFNPQRGRQRAANRRNFNWETVLSPGQSCPVPATMAAAVAEGRSLLVVKPILPEASTTGVGRSAASAGGALSSVQEQARSTSASDDFEEAVLMLPSPREWERDAVDDASYHRTLEFTPSEAGRTSIFCGVRATRDGAGRGVGRRKRRRAGRVMVLSFVPTMSLKNLLATRADVRLACPALTKAVGVDPLGPPNATNPSRRQATADGVWAGAIDRGTGLAWLHCPPHEEVTLAIRLRGFGWSDAVALPFLATAFENDEGGGRESVTTRPVSSRRHSQQPKGRERYGGNWRLRGAAARDRVEDRAVGVELKLTDSNGDMLRVHVEVKFSANGLRQVSLWVPYWVVNATSVPLTVQHYPSALSGELLENGLMGTTGVSTASLKLPAAYHPAANPRSSASNAERGSPTLLGGQEGMEGGERKHDNDAEDAVQGRLRGLVGDQDGDLFRFQALMLSHTNRQQQQGRVRVRVEGSTWSSPFGLDQDGEDGFVEIRGEPEEARRPLERVKRRWTAGPSGSEAERRAYAIGVSVKAAPAPFGRTKVVALTPRYVLVNATDSAIEVQQAGVDGKVEPLQMASGAQAVFHWAKAGDEGWFGRAPTVGSKSRRLVVRLGGEGWNWSGEISPEGEAEVTVRVRNSRSRQVELIRVGGTVEESSVRLVFRNELPSFAPYRIDNFSVETLTFKQVGVNVIETLLPYQSCAYSWDEPLGERALVVMKLAAGGGGGPRTKSRRGRRGEAIAAANAGRGEGRRAASRFGGVSGKKALRTLVGVYGLDLMKPYTVVGTLRIDMMADGPTRTLRFTDSRSGATSRASGRRGSSELSRAYPASATVPSSVSPLPLPPESAPGVSLEASMRLAGIGVSVIDSFPRELLYLTVGKVALDYAREGKGQRVRANIGKLQIDNQLLVTRFPALLYPVAEAIPIRHAPLKLSAGSRFRSLAADRHTGSSADEANRNRTCFEVIVHSDVSYDWVNYLRLASLRLSPLEVNLDMAVVNALVDMSSRVADLMEVEPPRTGSGPTFPSPASTVVSSSSSGAAPPVLLNLPHPPQPDGGSLAANGIETRPLDKLYVEQLAISPLRFHVSITSSSPTSVVDHLLPLDENDESGGGGVWSVTYAILRAMGTSLSQIENAPLRLQPLVLSHSFVNPEELLTILTAHYQGQILRQVLSVMASAKLLGSPLGLFSNMGAGMKDFFYEPLAGLTRSPFGFATGVLKGTSSLVQRTLYSVTGTTDSIVSSVSSGILASGAVDVLMRGGRSIVRPYGALDGILLGIAGAVRDPMFGLRSGGYSGLASGLFTGWVGLLLRPTYGALMTTSQLCQMMSGYLDPRLDREQKQRMLRTRPPRFFRSREQVLSVYTKEENIGEELLSRAHMGKYRSDGYIWHAIIKDMIVLVTGRRVLMLHGDTGRTGNANSLAARRHTYGVVEWEVEFGLVTWMEVHQETGIPNEARGPRLAKNEREGRGAHRAQEDVGAPGASLSIFHFPDVCAEASGRGSRTGKVLAALRFERRTMLCVSEAQARQIHAVILKQVPTLFSSSA